MIVTRCNASQNSGREGLVSEMPVVCLDQTSKTADTIVIPAVATNNQPVGANNQKLSLNKVFHSLVSG